VASIPWLVLGLFSRPDYAYSNGRVTSINGQMTAAGLLDLVQVTLLTACLGALGGAVFWAAAVWKVSNKSGA
jgi:hypothetical protein